MSFRGPGLPADLIQQMRDAYARQRQRQGQQRTPVAAPQGAQAWGALLQQQVPQRLTNQQQPLDSYPPPVKKEESRSPLPPPTGRTEVRSTPQQQAMQDRLNSMQAPPTPQQQYTGGFVSGGVYG